MEATTKNPKKKRRSSPLLGACAAAAVLALLLLIYMLSKPVPMAGSKSISISVVYQDGSLDSYSITTDARYLIDAADQIPELTIEGTTTEEFGLMMITVNGIRADYQTDGAYWALLLNEEPCNYGISQQPIKDGEAYRIVYTPAGS